MKRETVIASFLIRLLTMLGVPFTRIPMLGWRQMKRLNWLGSKAPAVTIIVTVALAAISGIWTVTHDWTGKESPQTMSNPSVTVSPTIENKLVFENKPTVTVDPTINVPPAKQPGSSVMVRYIVCIAVSARNCSPGALYFPCRGTRNTGELHWEEWAAKQCVKFDTAVRRLWQPPDTGANGGCIDMEMELTCEVTQ